MKRAILFLLLAGGLYAANELTTQTAIQYNKGGAIVQVNDAAQITVSGNGFIDTVVSVSTNESQFSFGSVTPKTLYFKNLTTNSWSVAQMGTNSGTYGAQVSASRSALYELPGTNLFIRAVTNSLLLRVTAIPE